MWLNGLLNVRLSVLIIKNHLSLQNKTCSQWRWGNPQIMLKLLQLQFVNLDISPHHNKFLLLTYIRLISSYCWTEATLCVWSCTYNTCVGFLEPNMVHTNTVTSKNVVSNTSKSITLRDEKQCVVLIQCLYRHLVDGGSSAPQIHNTRVSSTHRSNMLLTADVC